MFQVKWLEQQVSKKRVKRDAATSLFSDPKWPKLWYLVSLTLHVCYVSLFEMVVYCDVLIFCQCSVSLFRYKMN